MPPTSQPDRERELRVLLQEYAITREDTRTFWIVVPALVTVGAAAIGGGLVLLGSARANAPAHVWAFTPLLPLGISGLLIQQMAVHNVRSVYERTLERSINAALTQLAVPAVPAKALETRLAIPSYSHLMRTLFEFRALPWRYRSIPALQYLFLAVMALINIGAYVEAISQVGSGGWLILMLVLYPLLWLLVAVAAVGAFDLPQLWQTAMAASAADLLGDQLVDEIENANLRNPRNWDASRRGRKADRAKD